jgi:serine/threonine protein kinase
MIYHNFFFTSYTPYYVPPEILRFQKYDISCDIWSLGVIMYILCCGYPPFYSTHGKRISPGMEKRIKLGKYEFPENEWANVSNEAKSLIDEMLETAPERRLTIDKIMRSKFILGAAAAPRKKLNSIRIMNQDSKNYTEMLDSMGQALNELRVNYDQEIKLKEINEVRNKNPLLKKRLVKKLQQNLENQTIDEENETSKNNTDNENIVNTSKKTVNIADKITIIPNRDKFNFNTDENNNLDENDVTRSKLTRQYSSPVSAIYYSINIKENKNLE